MSFCPKCGVQLPEGANACPQCGNMLANEQPAQQNQQPAPQTTYPEQQPAPQTAYPEQQPAPQPVYPDPNMPYGAYPQQPAPEKKKPAYLVPLIIGAVAVVIFLILVFTHTICLSHKWEDATCTKPQTCEYCDKTKGRANGHAEGPWEVYEPATLIADGTEAILCRECGDVIKTRTIDMKVPAAGEVFFNFTDEEFIQWINLTTELTVDATLVELDSFDPAVNTVYKISKTDGETGFIIFNHGSNGVDGNVGAIMTYFLDDSAAGAVVLWLSAQLDYSFDSDDAIHEWIWEESVYFSNDLATMRLEMGDNYMYMMAPIGFIDELT